jgi:two-component system response regulator ResD
MSPQAGPRILLVEDNRNLRRVLRYSLARQGYRIDEAGTGPEALGQARRRRPALILLDLVLPELDGLEVCRTLRREMATPILILTVKDAEADRAEALRAGADDYMTKPFSMDDLRARIAALLEGVGSRPVRRPANDPGAGAAEQASGNRRRSGPMAVEFQMNRAARSVRLHGEEVPLSPREFELLSFLLAHPGQVQTRERIAERVWGGNVASNTITVHIRWLREKFETYEPPPFRITAVFGVGYRLDRSP